MEILSPNQMTLAQYIWNRIADDQVELCRTRALHSASNLYVNDRDIQKYIEEYWHAPLVLTHYLENKYVK